MQLPAKMEQFDAESISVVVTQNAVMTFQIVVMAVMRLNVVSYH